MFQQAIDQYRMAGELSLDNKGDVLASIATMLTSAGRKSEADSMMPEILELAIAGKADPYNLAVLCAARGDKEQGFKWLAKATANRQLMSGILRYDPQGSSTFGQQVCGVATAARPSFASRKSLRH